jgi:exosome complex exonuclease RRP6
VKIFHGADWDIEWLQKDFGLYVVNMFDTHQAAKLLNMSSLSLAYLLKYYCQRDANKQYQLADWRIRFVIDLSMNMDRFCIRINFRPLPDEYLRYARDDTHYLLYIYDRQRNQLLEMDDGNTHTLQTVHAKSNMICQKVNQFRSIYVYSLFKIFSILAVYQAYR